MSALSALCEFTHHSISRLQRKSGLTGRTAASRRGGKVRCGPKAARLPKLADCQGTGQSAYSVVIQAIRIFLRLN
jgi:hypothetical protein